MGFISDSLVLSAGETHEPLHEPDTILHYLLTRLLCAPEHLVEGDEEAAQGLYFHVIVDAFLLELDLGGLFTLLVHDEVVKLVQMTEMVEHEGLVVVDLANRVLPEVWVEEGDGLEVL